MLLNKKFIILFATRIVFNLAALRADLGTRRILPTSLTIREGEDMQLRLTKVFDQKEDSCYLKTPALQSYNLRSMSDESISEDDSLRIMHWSENGECGGLVKNISKKDGGRWRLTAKSQDRTIVDAVTVNVLDKFVDTVTEVSILSGLAYSLVLSENVSYCMVQRPHDELYVDVGNECKIEMARPTLAEYGKWMAKTGIPGQIEEVVKTTKVNVVRENLISGYRQSADGKLLHLYCNVVHYDEKLELCRFAKVNSSESSLRLSEGLRKGKYGYYGGGLASGECGLSIENPNESDASLWHCLVGFPHQSPFGAYIHVLNSRRTNDLHSHVTSSVSPVVTMVSKSLLLDCRASMALSYCRFQGPDGSIFTPLPEMDANIERAASSNYWYTGIGLHNGRCGMMISAAKKEHNGTWTCHMGPEVPDLELTSTIVVRIAETPLAATTKFVKIEKIGDSVSLQCQTVPNRVALQYCRFYSPENIGIHVSHEITEERPLILENGDKYWFSGSNTSIGECGLTIAQIKPRHFGNWICAAILEAQTTNLEAFDTIIVYIENNENLSVAAGMGIAMGAMAVAIAIAASIAFFVKIRKGTRIENTSAPGNNASEIISMCSLSSSSSSSSNIAEPI
ncbi:uncharacterized protein LOC107268147 isoform X2 [Cephus cinctus]|uniref:Uncharacterized protein LOC107268147 isoform X2 n=1 Tax=Cephus cinctus TaxID=211228 RepID=A0AAJ7RHV1_CEPCN|nr:uncharacterized protein LOC107268147 isoform X2 [Cephus cinctus]